MSTDSISPPARSSSPAAQRMRLYPKQRRLGLLYVRIPLHVTDIDALIRMRPASALKSGEISPARAGGTVSTAAEADGASRINPATS
jgi:hypothetical protein